MNTLDLDWRSQGVCRGLNVNAFFPERGDVVPEYVKEACEGCPVKLQCLTHALHHEKHGYWGGTTEEKRRTIRREQGIIAHSPESVFHKGEHEVRKLIRENTPKIRGRGRKAS